MKNQTWFHNIKFNKRMSWKKGVLDIISQLEREFSRISNNSSNEIINSFMAKIRCYKRISAIIN